MNKVDWKVTSVGKSVHILNNSSVAAADPHFTLSPQAKALNDQWGAVW